MRIAYCLSWLRAREFVVYLPVRLKVGQDAEQQPERGQDDGRQLPAAGLALGVLRVSLILKLDIALAVLPVLGKELRSLREQALLAVPIEVMYQPLHVLLQSPQPLRCVHPSPLV